jgi:hypothetical protein
MLLTRAENLFPVLRLCFYSYVFRTNFDERFNIRFSYLSDNYTDFLSTYTRFIANFPSSLSQLR